MNTVITGANRGIGLELVKQICAESNNAGSSSNSNKTAKIYALCRKTSDELTALAAEAEEVYDTKVIIVEDIDVSQDSVVEKLQTTFLSSDDGKNPSVMMVPIDLLIHNAGAFGPPEKELTTDEEIFGSQSLTNITMDRMRYAFELNTLGPLRVTQALMSNLKKSSTSAEPIPKKVIIITSMMGSLSDNTSGGLYAYRTAKAAVNMVGASLAHDLKKEDIAAVGLIHPGAVMTGFGSVDGKKRPEEKRWPGQQDVEPSVRGVMEAIEAISMENTGAFLHGNYGNGVKPCPW